MPPAAWFSCQSSMSSDRHMHTAKAELAVSPCRRPVRCLAFLGEDLVAAGGAGGGVILLRRGEAGAWEPRQVLQGNGMQVSSFPFAWRCLYHYLSMPSSVCMRGCIEFAEVKPEPADCMSR